MFVLHWSVNQSIGFLSNYFAILLFCQVIVMSVSSGSVPFSVSRQPPSFQIVHVRYVPFQCDISIQSSSQVIDRYLVSFWFFFFGFFFWLLFLLVSRRRHGWMSVTLLEFYSVLLIALLWPVYSGGFSKELDDNLDCNNFPKKLEKKFQRNWCFFLLLSSWNWNSAVNPGGSTSSCCNTYGLVISN